METIITVLIVALCVYIILKVATKALKVIAFCVIVLIVCIYLGILPADIIPNFGITIT